MMSRTTSYKEYSNFEQSNADTDLGNDWGFYEDLEITAPSLKRNRLVTPKSMTPKSMPIPIPNKPKQHEIDYMNNYKDIFNTPPDAGSIEKTINYLTHGAVMSVIVLSLIIIY